MGLSKNIPEVNRAINNILIQEYGTITSTLAKRLGQENLNDIDNLVHDTVNAAKALWSSSEIPNDPRSTLWQFVTDNTSDLFCDKLRYKNLKQRRDLFAARNLYYPDSAESTENKVIMLFTCCHPSIQDQCRIYLVLKILCGYSTSYIARLFSMNENSVSDQIFNAKKSIIEQNVPMCVPMYNRDYRLRLVQNTLIELFENGRNPSNEKLGTVPELCYVSINLARVLSGYEKTSNPELYAHIAMMLLRASRIESLTDEKGNILTLKEQDRSRWNTEMIQEGLNYLQKSAAGDTISRTHLQAGVSAVHSLAGDYASTNWNKIIDLYDKYLNLHEDPDVEVERAIAVSRAKGSGEGINSLNLINNISDIQDKKLFYTTYGNLYFRTHDYSSALSSYREALNYCSKPRDRNYLSNKVAICEQRIEMTSRYKYGLSF